MLNYNLNNSHVLPALIRKFHEAKENNVSFVEMWGTGLPQREFLHADDLAGACHFLMQHYKEPVPINVGLGRDVSIAELAAIIQGITGFEGKIVWDSSKPDGTARKLMDVSKCAALGWQASIDLIPGITAVYKEVFISKAG